VRKLARVYRRETALNPLRDPLFYLTFATLFAVAFAATYLVLA
jgi:hypothetical protein